MSNYLSNLSVTVINGSMSSASGAMMDYLQSTIANGGRDKNCKFYYSGSTGGSILQVIAKKATHLAVSALKDEAVNQFNSLLNGKKKSINEIGIKEQSAKEEAESKLYGKIEANGGTVYALDDWGGISPDALMLSIKTDETVTISQTFPVYGEQFGMNAGSEYKYGSGPNKDTYRKAGVKVNTVTGNEIVWYDTTALITINSDRNIVVTKVQGRDYSRKELVSNGDIKFSVSGQMTSGRPDVYPAEEVQKFIKVMQYKGIVKVNNQLLDQFKIENIIITDFSLSPKEGYKGLQNYTFSAIGLQPSKDIEIKNDTVDITTPKEVESTEKDDSIWKNMLNSQLEGLKSMAKDVTSQGAALVTGMLENKL